MKTKIQLLSDLHNEFYPAQSVPDITKTNADIIILAGDINTGAKGVEWAMKQAYKLDKPIIYVPGNHEYYGHDFDSTLDKMRYAADGSNVILLDNDSITISGIRILGTTLWTDYKADPATEQVEAMRRVGNTLNDHRIIKYKGKYFTPSDALSLHIESVDWLKHQLSLPSKQPTVVVTHHAPSGACQHMSFHLSAISTGFHSTLDDLVGLADLWLFGHTHSNLSTEIKGTKLISNQFGYKGHEELQDFDPNLVLEVRS